MSKKRQAATPADDDLRTQLDAMAVKILKEANTETCELSDKVAAFRAAASFYCATRRLPQSKDEKKGKFNGFGDQIAGALGERGAGDVTGEYPAFIVGGKPS